MLKRTVNIFIFLIVCISPIIINPIGSDHYFHVKVIFLGIVCLIMFLYLLTYLMISRKFKEIKFDLSDIILLGYFTAILLSTVFSIDVSISLLGQPVLPEGLFTIACYLFVYIIASKFYVFEEKHLKYLYISALIIAVYGIFQYFHFDPILIFLKEESYQGAISTIGNTDFVGTYFTLIIPLMVFSYIKSSKLKYLFMSAICLFCLICSMTRSAWLALLIGLALLGYFVFKKNIGKKIFISVLIVFATVTIGLNLFNNNIYFSRFKTIYKDTNSVVADSSNKDNAGSGRIYIWNNALALIETHPILGSGPDTFGIDFKKAFGNGTVVDMTATFNKAHNEYLNIMSTTGIPSCILYLTFVSLILYRSRNKFKNNIFLIPIFCAVIGYLVQAFFNISIAANAPILWVMLGILSLQQGTQQQLKQQPQ